NAGIDGRCESVHVGHALQVDGNLRLATSGEAGSGEIEFRETGSGGGVPAVAYDVGHRIGGSSAKIGAARDNLQAFQSQALRIHSRVAQVHVHGSVRRREAAGGGVLTAADVDRQLGGELSALVEADGLRLLIDLAEYALKFVVQNAAVAGKGAGSGLRGQRTK